MLMKKSKQNLSYVWTAKDFQFQTLFWEKKELKKNLLSFVNAVIALVLHAMAVGKKCAQKKTPYAQSVDSVWKIFLKIFTKKKMLRRKLKNTWTF